MPKKVLLIIGSGNGEDLVSHGTGESMFMALQKLGHDVTKKDFIKDIVDLNEYKNYDIVCNGTVGKFGEDGTIQSVLNFLKVPYTHSGALSSAICMNKWTTKLICGSVGVPFADSILIRRDDILSMRYIDIVKSRGWNGYVVKPIASGSSLGVHVCINNAPSQIDTQYYGENEDLMLEEYCDGRELDVCVLEDRICIVEPVFDGPYLTYDMKYMPNQKRIEVNPYIDKKWHDKLMDYVISAHKVLGCKTISRYEFRLDEKKDILVMIENNTQPGLTKTSMFTSALNNFNISFESMTEILLNNAAYEG